MTVVGRSARRCAGFLAAAAATATAALWGPGVGAVSAQPCPEVEVVFARGTSEAPGVGGIGQAFVDAVRAQAGGRTVGVYPVNYPASSDFTAGVEFAGTVIDGIRDASQHVESMAASCPDTRMVLGGYSQGAVVAGFVTSAAIPEGVPPAFVPEPMPPEVAEHVAAVALFAKPSDAFMQQYGAPPIVIGPLYRDKTIELCTPDDTICSGVNGGGPTIAHALYAVNGDVGKAATFAVDKL